MGQDYYAVLGLTRSCTDADIKKSYRKLALKYHPHKNQEPGSDLKFKQVAEVYDVLSNYQLRAIYDQFGEEGLKNGIPNIEGGFTKGYVFHGDAEKVFKEFFGGENPFLEMYEISPHDVEIGMFGGLKGRGQRKQDAAIERDLYLTLEEVYHGCIKKMKITRRVMNEDGHSSSIREKILTINVKPGWRAGTKIIFSKEGDQGPNNIPADIIFLIKDKPHVLFQRDGDNVIYTASVTLKEALIGCIIDVPTLDGRVLSIPVNEIICHGYKKVVENEGMPISKSNNRGDLVILFNIIFPQRLTSEQKDLISQALG